MANETLQQRNRKTLTKLVVSVVAMFGFAFAMVPLYEVLCEITGLNGKTASSAAVAPSDVDEQRQVTVQLVASNSKDMPWEFRPDVRSVKLHPGEIKQVSFYVKNPTGADMWAQTVPSVSPGLAAQYIKKTQCFCFDKQQLTAGGDEHMPMIFYLDPDIPRHVNTVTLSYTIFDITDRVNAEQSAGKRDLAAR